MKEHEEEREMATQSMLDKSENSKCEQNRIEREIKNAAMEPLLEKAIAGDGDSLHKLCEELSKSILFRTKYVLGKEMNLMDAEDVSQEVFLRICENIKSLRDPKLFRAWLARIIINESNRYMTIKMRGGFNLDIDDYTDLVKEDKVDYLPEDFFEKSELRQTFMDIISRLSVRQREVVMLRYYDELSTTEIAEVMDVTLPCVSRYLKLAHENIKVELQKQPDTFPLKAASALAIEPLVTEIMHIEAVNIAPSSSGWLETALAPCAPYFIASSVTAVGEGMAAEAISSTAAMTTGAAAASTTAVSTAAAATSAFVIGGAVCAVAVTAAVVATIAAPDEVTPTYEVKDSYIPYVLMAGYNVGFSGGIGHENYVHVNPEQAWPDLDIDVTVIRWSIIRADNNEVIYQGSNGTEIESALSSLREKSADGEYFIYFQVENDAGAVYELRRNFYIMT